MGYGYGGHMMYGYGWLIWLVIIVVAGVLIYYLAVQSRRSAPSESAPGESALDILKKRYARGEISKEDFERMKNDIQ